MLLLSKMCNAKNWSIVMFANIVSNALKGYVENQNKNVFRPLRYINFGLQI